jgi:hypothetical protein
MIYEVQSCVTEFSSREQYEYLLLFQPWSL